MSGPLRALMVVDSYPPDSLGGAERVVHGWSRELAARGCEVWVLAGRIGLPPGPDEERAGYRIRRWSSRRRTFLDGYASALRACAAAAGRLFAERPPDIVHCHQGLSAYAVISAELGAPAVCTFHAPWAEEFAEDARAREEGLPVFARPFYRLAVRLKTPRIHKMEGFSLARSRAVATLSRYSRDLISRAHGLAPERVEVLPGGADLDRFTPAGAGEREEIRKRLGFTGPTLLSVRRLVRRMGLDLLIRAMVPIRAAAPDARLVLAGRGPARESLERLAARLGVGDAVVFAGFVSEEDLPDYYRGADLFVLPTRTLEGYGVATLEALASGTPVVGTPGGATPEILGPLNADLLAEAATPEAIAAAALRWLTAPGRLGALRDQCREYVERRYRWSEAGEALEAFYRRALSGE
ncbi:MAG: glycosyltransferase family 4 protein [bacterium]